MARKWATFTSYLRTFSLVYSALPSNNRRTPRVFPSTYAVLAKHESKGGRVPRTVDSLTLYAPSRLRPCYYWSTETNYLSDWETAVGACPRRHSSVLLFSASMAFLLALEESVKSINTLISGLIIEIDRQRDRQRGRRKNRAILFIETGGSNSTEKKFSWDVILT